MPQPPRSISQSREFFQSAPVFNLFPAGWKMSANPELSQSTSVNGTIQPCSDPDGESWLGPLASWRAWLEGRPWVVRSVNVPLPLFKNSRAPEKPHMSSHGASEPPGLARIKSGCPSPFTSPQVGWWLRSAYLRQVITIPGSGYCASAPYLRTQFGLFAVPSFLKKVRYHFSSLPAMRSWLQFVVP